MKRGAPTLTGPELEIMKIVWKLKTATVRQVYEALLKRRRIAYTTVMTTMNIMEQKGFLKKRDGDRAFVYASKRPEQQVIRAMVREFIYRVFNGATEPLLVHLVGDERLTAKDLEEIRRNIASGGRSSGGGKPA